VHVGARGATPKQVANVCKMFLRHEVNFDRIVSASRRGNENTFCRSNRTRGVLAAMMSTLNSVRSVQGAALTMNGGYQQGYHHYRYHKLNLSSYLTHGTLEFRQHQGTVDADKACNWIRLVTGFVAVGFSAPTVTDLSDAPFEQLMRMTDSDGEAYFTARRDHFEGRA